MIPMEQTLFNLRLIYFYFLFFTAPPPLFFLFAIPHHYQDQGKQYRTKAQEEQISLTHTITTKTATTAHRSP